jgi:hypothetical protein
MWGNKEMQFMDGEDTEGLDDLVSLTF